MPSRVALVWVVTCLIWSTVWLFIKIGVRDVPPVSFAAMRLVIAILVMVPVTLASRTPLPKSPGDWRLIAGTGVILLGLNYALLNWGLQYVSSGLTAVLQAMTPAFALVFSHYLLHDEPMTVRKVAGLAMGIAGIGVIFWDQLSFGGHRSFAGAVTVTLGAVCVAFAYVMIRRHGRHLAPRTRPQRRDREVPPLEHAQPFSSGRVPDFGFPIMTACHEFLPVRRNGKTDRTGVALKRKKSPAGIAVPVTLNENPTTLPLSQGKAGIMLPGSARFKPTPPPQYWP